MFNEDGGDVIYDGLFDLPVKRQPIFDISLTTGFLKKFVQGWIAVTSDILLASSVKEDVSEIAGTYLKRVKSSLLKKDIDFLIVVLGVVDGLERHPGRINSYEKIKRISEEQDIPLIDTIPLFEREKKGSLRLRVRDELHFNKKGSQIVAKAIRGYIINHNLKD